MSNLVKFVLVGPHAGKSIGFCKDIKGEARYNFIDGVMAVHPTKVNGRFIKRMKQEYSAVLEGEAHGISDVSKSGDDALGGEEVHDDGLTTPEPSAASRDAIQLQGNGDAKAGKEKQPAKGRKGSRTKTAG